MATAKKGDSDALFQAYDLTKEEHRAKYTAYLKAYLNGASDDINGALTDVKIMQGLQIKRLTNPLSEEEDKILKSAQSRIAIYREVYPHDTIVSGAMREMSEAVNNKRNEIEANKAKEKSSAPMVMPPDDQPSAMSNKLTSPETKSTLKDASRGKADYASELVEGILAQKNERSTPPKTTEVVTTIAPLKPLVNIPSASPSDPKNTNPKSAAPTQPANEPATKSGGTNKQNPKNKGQEPRPAWKNKSDGDLQWTPKLTQYDKEQAAKAHARGEKSTLEKLADNVKGWLSKKDKNGQAIGPDVNGDGTVDKNELNAYFNRPDAKGNSIDADGDSKISKEEFNAARERIKKELGFDGMNSFREATKLLTPLAKEYETNFDPALASEAKNQIPSALQPANVETKASPAPGGK